MESYIINGFSVSTLLIIFVTIGLTLWINSRKEKVKSLMALESEIELNRELTKNNILALFLDINSRINSKDNENMECILSLIPYSKLALDKLLHSGVMYNIPSILKKYVSKYQFNISLMNRQILQYGNLRLNLIGNKGANSLIVFHDLLLIRLFLPFSDGSENSNSKQLENLKMRIIEKYEKDANKDGLISYVESIIAFTESESVPEIENYNFLKKMLKKEIDKHKLMKICFR